MGFRKFDFNDESGTPYRHIYIYMYYLHVTCDVTHLFQEQGFLAVLDQIVGSSRSLNPRPHHHYVIHLHSKVERVEMCTTRVTDRATLLDKRGDVYLKISSGGL